MSELETFIQFPFLIRFPSLIYFPERPARLRKLGKFGKKVVRLGNGASQRNRG
jgi:hypothetical protein